MLTSQAFRDYFPSCLSPFFFSSQGCRSPFKRLTLQIFPWWLCNRPELLAQPPIMGSSLKVPRGSLSLRHADGPLRHVASLIPPGYLISGILSGRCSTFSGYLTSGACPADIPPYSDISHPAPVRPTFHLLRISHIRRLSGRRSNFSRYLTSGACPADVPPSPDISHPAPLSPNGRGGRFNFPEQTCPDPSVTPIQSARLTCPRSPHLALGV